jgi:hypothetical protein
MNRPSMRRGRKKSKAGADRKAKHAPLGAARAFSERTGVVRREHQDVSESSRCVYGQDSAIYCCYKPGSCLPMGHLDTI